MSFKSNMYIDDMLPEVSTYFKEDLLCETIVLPAQYPSIEKILNIVVSPKVVNLKVINTPVGLSNEGQSLTGYKLIVEVLLKQKITYTSNNPSQSVHALYYETMKSMFVVIPATNDLFLSCNELLDLGKINVSPFVEGISCRTLNCRSIYGCILLFVDVKIC